MTDKETNVKRLFELYLVEVEREEALNEQMAAIAQEKDAIVKQIFDATEDKKTPYMHPKLGSVIPIARKRKEGGCTHYFRHVQAKAVQVGD